jgi:hypothetical protein
MSGLNITPNLRLTSMWRMHGFFNVTFQYVLITFKVVNFGLKFCLEHAMKAQKGSRDIAALFL